MVHGVFIPGNNICALFVCFSIQDFVKDETNSLDMRLWVVHHYGSSMMATYTMFEVTMAGCWPNYFRPLVDRISGWYSIFVFLYISVVVFAVTRIITALFLKETLQAAANDADQQAAEQARARAGVIDKLRTVFSAVDTSGDGSLSFEEFELICHNPDVIVYLKMLDLEVSNAEGLFHLLDYKNCGEINFEEFLKGVLRLKGQARSLDLVALMRAHDCIHEDVLHIMKTLDDMHEMQHHNADAGET